MVVKFGDKPYEIYLLGLDQDKNVYRVPAKQYFHQNEALYSMSFRKINVNRTQEKLDLLNELIEDKIQLKTQRSTN